MSQFYSYLWLRSDGSPYYVGKGKGRRAFVSFDHGVHCPPEKSRILVFLHSTETEAFESEKAFIKWFGRQDIGTGCLRNLTDGGEGASGCVQSPERRQKQSRALKGRSPSIIHRSRLSTALKGKQFSSTHRQHLSEALKGKNNHQLGRIRSESTKCRMRASANQRWMTQPMSDETKAKLRASRIGRPGPNKGKTFSAETRIKMSESHKRRSNVCPTDL